MRPDLPELLGNEVEGDLGVDVFPPEKRRDVMRRIRSKGTKPEREIRRILDSLGVRYEYQAELFGHAVDFLIPGRKLVIEYRSCYWHGCEKHFKGVKGGIMGADWWAKKIERNRQRDKELDELLTRNGYKLLVIWDHDRRRMRELIEGALNAQG